MTNPSHSLAGVLCVDKPAGISSARAVDRVKRVLPRGTKVGHAGTLDPFATGVLLILIGRATKLCESLMGLPKQYEAQIKLGATTATLDPESPEEPTADAVPSPEDQVRAALARQIGQIMQRPPTFSAMKVGGRRAYELARKGHDVHIEPRVVHVYGVELRRYQWPLVDVRIDCGRGTYVRSIARDVGQALGVGGYLTQLARTKVGQFDLAGAVPVDQLDGQRVVERLVPVDAVKLRREP